MTLKGFSVPLTPQGRSALATLPPWHYSSDCIAIEYWTDPEAIAALLPPGLTPDKKSAGRAFFAPLRVGRGYRLGMAYSVTDLRILKNYAKA